MRARAALTGVAALCAAIVGLTTAWVWTFPSGHRSSPDCQEQFGHHWHLPIGRIIWA